jgi:hypothetical protein
MVDSFPMENFNNRGNYRFTKLNINLKNNTL